MDFIAAHWKAIAVVIVIALLAWAIYFGFTDAPKDPPEGQDGMD